MKESIFILSLLLCSLTGNAQISESQDSVPSVELSFSKEGGFYDGEIDLYIYAPGAEIYFTTNGNTPGPGSYKYHRPVNIRETVTIRAMAIHPDGRKSDVYNHTYFINEPVTDLPIVSIGISPSVLFHPYKGLFMLGSNAVDTLWKKPGANFWSKREVPAGVEIFESDGRCVHRSLSGFRLFGGMSRLFPQKSIALVARKRYGERRIRHDLFKIDEPDKFKFLVLRNAGSDFGKSHFRDALMTSLVDDWDLEKQAYRPSHVYINGNYWGIYNIREKVNRFFIESHHKEVDNDSLDLIEHKHTLKRGSLKEYRKLIKYLEENDLADPANYTNLQTMMEVDNFMDFQIAQIYFDNQDAGGNIKFWRPQTEDGRWRWILYDTDWGFGLHEEDAYKNNSLDFHTTAHGRAWPNPPWSTFILRKLLRNDEFRAKFVNRFADRLNSSFHEHVVLSQIDSFYQVLRPEMRRHLDRWKLSRTKWEEEVGILRSFAQERPAYMRMHLMGKFNTGGQRKLIVSTNPGGRIIINNNLSISNDTLEAIYFERYPINLKVVAHQGYRFSHWEGIETNETTRKLTFALSDQITRLRAVFEPFTHPFEGAVVINEVCAKNGKSGDWIEIYNRSDKRVSLKNWSLSDLKQNEFTFPGVFIAPNDYLVVCKDSARFVNTYPEAYNVIGGMGFGLNKRRENLALYSILGAVVDSISYEIFPIDSAFTFNLLLPDMDNSEPASWEVRIGKGSPNAANPYYVESKVRHVQAQWVQMGLAAGIFLIGLILLGFRQKKLI